MTNVFAAGGCETLFEKLSFYGATIRDRLHENDLRLSIVVYSDTDGIKPEYKKYLVRRMRKHEGKSQHRLLHGRSSYATQREHRAASYSV